MFQGFQNPYSSPAAASGRGGELVFHPEQSQMEAWCESRRVLYRRLRLAGLINGSVEWDARSLLEVVRVGKQQVRCTVPLWYTPRFDFELLAEGHRFAATIEVRLTRVLPVLVRRFRFAVEDQVLYEEGRWPDGLSATTIEGPRRRPR